MTSQHVKCALMVATIALSTVTLGMPSKASAQSARVKTSHSAVRHAQFKFLKVSEANDVITISYRFDQGTSVYLNNTGIKPRLFVYLPAPNNANRNEFAYSVPLLTSGSRTVRLPKMNLVGVGGIVVSVVGYNEAYRLKDIGIGTGRPLKTQRVVMHSKMRSSTRPSTSTRQPQQSKLLAACKQNLKLIASVDVCLGKAKAFHPDVALKLIPACGGGTLTDKGMVACMSTAKIFRANAALMVSSCDIATQSEGGLVKCLKLAHQLKSPERRVMVDECARGTTNDSATLTCIDASKILKYDQKAKLIRSCNAHTHRDADFISCIKIGSTVRRNASSVILACGEASKYSTGLMECVKQSGMYNASASIVKKCGKTTKGDKKLSACVVDIAQRP